MTEVDDSSPPLNSEHTHFRAGTVPVTLKCILLQFLISLDLYLLSDTDQAPISNLQGAHEVAHEHQRFACADGLPGRIQAERPQTS